MSRRQEKQLVASSDVDRRNFESKTIEDGAENGITLEDLVSSVLLSKIGGSSENGATGNK